MKGTTKTLMIICGPPAVGKMAVGRCVSERTGIPLFHNHQSIEPVIQVFPFGSPPFKRLVGNFREAMFDEVAKSDAAGFIFTYVWAFDSPDSLAFVRGLMDKFESRGWRTVFIELWADTKTRLDRNRTEERLREKPSKRDVDASNQRLQAADEQFQLSSDGDFPFPDRHLKIDNTRLSADDAALLIIRHFGLES